MKRIRIQDINTMKATLLSLIHKNLRALYGFYRSQVFSETQRQIVGRGN